MAVSLVYMPIMVFRDANDAPVPFGKVWSYLGGTSTPAALYATPDGATAHPNPAILNASGQLVAYATVGQAFKLNLLDANNVQVPGWPIDNIVVTPNGDPSLIAGYSSVAAMHTYLDPGETGTEVVADSLLEWQQQIQFVLRELKRTTHWNETYALQLLNGLNWSSDSAATIANVYPPTGTTTQTYTFVLPFTWQLGTNLTFVFLRKTTSGVGTAIMNYTVNRERDGQGIANIVTNTAINFLPGNGFAHRTSLTIPGAALLSNDAIVVQIQRFGDDASDTDAGNILFNGIYVLYTGLAGS